MRQWREAQAWSNNREPSERKTLNAAQELEQTAEDFLEEATSANEPVTANPLEEGKVQDAPVSSERLELDHPKLRELQRHSCTPALDSETPILQSPLGALALQPTGTNTTGTSWRVVLPVQSGSAD